MLGRVVELLGLVEKSCVVCGLDFKMGSQGYICDECLNDITPGVVPCREHSEFIESCRVFSAYEGVLREALRTLKFRSVKPLAYELGKRFSAHMKEFIEEVRPDLISYVPVHTFRMWNRGFDHNVALLEGAEIEFTSLLNRVKHSAPLASKGKEERIKAVSGAFSLIREKVSLIENKRILVFDDILTTGATSSQVGELLMSYGAMSVYFYFLAKEGVN